AVTTHFTTSQRGLGCGSPRVALPCDALHWCRQPDNKAGWLPAKARRQRLRLTENYLSSSSLGFVHPYGGRDVVGGFLFKEESVHVWVIKCRSCSYCRGYAINAREAAEPEHVDEALTAAHIGTVALVIHKHVIGIAARRNGRAHISASRIYGC